MRSRIAVLVLLAATLAVAAVSVGPLRAQGSREERWEYCYLGRPSLGEGLQQGEYVAQVHYYTSRGDTAKTVTRTGPKVEHDSGWTVRIQAIARLGAEGWELVTLQDEGMIFKRRLP